MTRPLTRHFNERAAANPDRIRISNLERRITNQGQIAFAALHTFGTHTVAGDNAIHYLDMEDGATGIFETSNDLVFENAENVGLSGSPWGIKCLANGTYIVKENSFVGGGTAGVKVTCYHTLTGGGGESFYQPGRVAALIGDTWDAGSSDVKLFFEEWTDATDANPAPVYINPYARLVSGSDITVAAQTMVIYLGLYAGAGAL